MTASPSAELCGIVVHWHDAEGARQIAEVWGSDSRFELLVVDNGSVGDLTLACGTVLRPGQNLGFAGAINRALQETEAPLILILNSDSCPEPGSLEQLLAGFSRHPEASGLAPRLIGRDGESQHRWQLRPLPSPLQLVLQAMMLPGWSGPTEAPSAGSPVEQPAAAALALRREVLAELGGLDELFYPAWFEDVDLAARMKSHGKTIVYWPAAEFVHGLGTSVGKLGYPAFLWLHYRNLLAYQRKHHGRLWAEITRLLIVPVCIVRLLLLPLRKPKRAPDRQEAARGLLSLAVGTLTRWTKPQSLADRFRRTRSGYVGA